MPARGLPQTVGDRPWVSPTKWTYVIQSIELSDEETQGRLGNFVSSIAQVGAVQAVGALPSMDVGYLIHCRCPTVEFFLYQHSGPERLPAGRETAATSPYVADTAFSAS